MNIEKGVNLTKVPSHSSSKVAENLDVPVSAVLNQVIHNDVGNTKGDSSILTKRERQE